MFQHQRNSSHVGTVVRSRFGRAAAVVVAAALVAAAGCNTETPNPVDVSKTPWLDPKVQIEGLKNPDFRVRGLSAFNLGNMGDQAVDAIPELESLARDDSNQKVRDNAQEALEKIRRAAGIE